ncbi:hypothetical protein [Quadrisphaera setariae]|uniref:Uncharacterized protein n=1 Tax=Quadrisphaera setariae TaxID=2593304 RepID=A0A5C8ZER0_9ACTN|nr:hypothetical protein [Quadrisphaera setariae]TXR56307.1 hypothetical protein FMM08_09315 [Quadrisphaera setariae]
MPEPHEIEGPFAGIAADVVAGAVFAAVAGGGVAGVLAGAFQPIATRALELSSREMVGHQQRGVAVYVVGAAQAGVEPQELLDKAAEGPDRLHLACSAAQAAGESRYPERIIALGRALARGLLAEDDAVLDHEQLVVEALSRLDRPHLVVLWALLEDEPGRSPGSWRQLTLSWVELQERIPGYGAASLTRLVAALDREGLLDTPTMSTVAPDDGRPDDLHPGEFLAVSDFGIDVMTELLQAGLQRPS